MPSHFPVKTSRTNGHLEDNRFREPLRRQDRPLRDFHRQPLFKARPVEKTTGLVDKVIVVDFDHQIGQLDPVLGAHCQIVAVRRLLLTLALYIRHARSLLSCHLNHRQCYGCAADQPLERWNTHQKNPAAPQADPTLGELSACEKKSETVRVDRWLFVQGVHRHWNWLFNIN
ncbi:hypothetical protein [Pseudomonas fluorescens]|uniref:Uncharacterized protein n=1 Tax=Pseudomonas fluorescens TaxID=294 RepID=A0A5E7FTV0_PSEFL|nr:hypothetical protein [Pseudomonas fluorescens]VVO42736.1 hypothetical protein PS710_06081 [Pseudomonas fluorescens]